MSGVPARQKDEIIGYPRRELIGTSLAERSNQTIRMHCRRLTRLTNGFGKKLDNPKAAMNLHFCFYNFVRFHRRRSLLAKGLCAAMRKRDALRCPRPRRGRIL